MRLPLQIPRAAGLVVRALRAGLGALATLVLVTCTDNPIGPGRLSTAALQVRPVFDANARFAPLVLTSARLIVVRPATDTITTVTGTFNATTNQVQLTATVLLHGPSEDLNVTLELYAGSLLIFSGTQRLTVGAGSGGQPQSVPVSYTGTGAGGSHFASLDMTAATGGLTLNSNVFVDAALENSIGAGASLLTMNGKILTAHQFAVAGNLTVDNPQLVLDEGGVGAVQTFNSVVLQNNATTTMLKVIGVCGAAAARTITFNGLTFPTTGSNTYVDLTSSNGFGLSLIVAGSNNPTGGPSRSVPPFGTTVNGATVIWQ